MDLSSIEQIIRTQVPNAPDSEVELYLNSVERDMGFGADYSDKSDDWFVEDFELYIQDKTGDIDEVKKPSTKMTKKELKEMIKAAFLSEALNDDAALGRFYDPKVNEADEEEKSLDDILASITGTKVDPYLAEAKDEEETDITVDAEEETTDGGEEKLANDSIVVDKKIVSLSSLPQQTRKILDSLETLRAQAEEFGDQKFITQVGNTITFFTRDFVVAGDEPTKAKVDEVEDQEEKYVGDDERYEYEKGKEAGEKLNESLEVLKMKKLAGLLTEGEYTKALLKEYELDDNKLQAFIDRYNKLPRKMGTLDGGDKSYIKDYIKSNPTKLEGEFDDALFSDEAATKFLNGLLDTPRGQNISFMKAKSQYKSKPSWVTGNDANPWGPGYDYEEYEEIPGI